MGNRCIFFKRRGSGPVSWMGSHWDLQRQLRETKKLHCHYMRLQSEANEGPSLARKNEPLLTLETIHSGVFTLGLPAGTSFTFDSLNVLSKCRKQRWEVNYFSSTLPPRTQRVFALGSKPCKSFWLTPRVVRAWSSSADRAEAVAIRQFEERTAQGAQGRNPVPCGCEASSLCSFFSLYLPTVPDFSLSTIPDWLHGKQRVYFYLINLLLCTHLFFLSFHCKRNPRTAGTWINSSLTPSESGWCTLPLLSCFLSRTPPLVCI